MVSKERQQCFSEYLDKEKNNKLFVRFVFNEDFSEVEEFAVIYLATIKEETYEIIRYDCSKRETVNVHQFFRRPPVKICLNKEKSFETLNGFLEDMRRNWMLYRARFMEKRP